MQGTHRIMITAGYLAVKTDIKLIDRVKDARIPALDLHSVSYKAYNQTKNRNIYTINELGENNAIRINLDLTSNVKESTTSSLERPGSLSS